jgi:peptide/nickel transport system substrate-binding protein
MTDTDNLSRRRFLQGTGAAATAAALAGCTGDGDSGSDDTTTATDTTTSSGEGDNGDGGGETDTSKMVRMTSSTMSTLDPVAATDTTSGSQIQNIFDCLTNYPNGQTNVENLLATGLETSDNGATLTFSLKEGVEYSNGDEVTAQDFVYSFERLAGSSNSRRAGFILNTLAVKHETETETVDGEEQEVYVPGSLAVTAEDDYTLTLELEQAFYAASSMLAYTSFAAIPEGIVGDVEGYDGQMEYQEFATANPVGSGPYTLETWNQSSEITLSARDSYHGGEIQNGGLTKAVFNETNPAYTYATVNVNADYPSVPSSRYEPDKRSFEGTDERNRKYGTYGPLENGLTADYYEVAELGTFYLAFNCEAVPKPVRKAVAYAFSQQSFLNNIYPRPAQPAYHFTPPSIFPGGPSNYADQAEDYKWGYQTGPQLDKATQVMEDAGYGPDNQFNMTFNMSSGLASSWGGDLFTLLRDQLTTAHIKMELESADWSTYLQQGRNGNFELFFLGWIADYPGADNFLSLAYPPNSDTSKEAPLSNFNWSEETGDAAAQAKEGWQMIQDNYAPGESNREARAEGGLMMEKALEEDAVMLPAYHGIAQYFKYQWVDEPRNGAMGGSRSKDHTTSIGDRGEYE